MNYDGLTATRLPFVHKRVHYTKNCNAKIKQDGTRTQCDYANSPHPCHSTLTSLFLPPVALQKGERDTQVQFRGRRHSAPPLSENFVSFSSGVAKVVDIDPLGSMGRSKGWIKSYGSNGGQ
ncbi:hypothetical protein T06_8355 [Trichinella sp. T6]|nr:hypothetical protein T06_8355 [Trichinella sp. T6]